jgi:F-type H+-transporting ATPase subunit delta
MAEMATLARPYAEALFKSSQAKNSLEDTQGWLDEMALVAQDAQLLDLAKNPAVSRDALMQVMTRVGKHTLPQEGLNFLHVVIEHKRLGAMAEIAEQFRAHKNALAGASDATIESAYPMDEVTLSQLKKVLEKKFSRQLNLTVELCPELIGGVRVVVGDEVFDTSVKARLEHMKVTLMA